VTLALRGSAQASPDEFGFCQNGLAVVERRGETGFEEFVPAKVRRLTDALQAQNAALAGLGPMNGLIFTCVVTISLRYSPFSSQS